jgi:predicted DNA-binding transcriptional regulator AlpA
MSASNKSNKLRIVVRWPVVLKATGLSKSQVEEKIKEGLFPAPFPLSEGGRAVGWFEDEIIEYQEQREAQRGAAALERSEAARERYQTILQAKEEREVAVRAGEAAPPTRRQLRRERRRQLREQRLEAEASKAVRERAR